MVTKYLQEDLQEQPPRVRCSGILDDLFSAELEEYFSTVTRLLDAFVVVNLKTKRSTGFGFITIDKSEDLDEFLAKTHYVQGTKVRQDTIATY